MPDTRVFFWMAEGFVLGVALCAIIAGYIWWFRYKGFSEKLDTEQALRHLEHRAVVEEAEKIAYAKTLRITPEKNKI